MERKFSQSGRICAVDYYGTIVVVCISAAEGEAAAIQFDHRRFQQLLQSEDCCAFELLGRNAEFDGETFILTD